jgi:HK97 family phage portal protein
VSTVSEFTIGGRNYSGVPVGESTALGISAFFRAISLIAGSVAQLPMRTLRIVDGEITQETRSVFDDPGGVVGMTPFEWKETVILHQLLHGDAFLAHVYNQAGALAGLVPLHPLCMQLDQPQRRDADDPTSLVKSYTATLDDGSRHTFTGDKEMTHCPAMSVDGRRGLSLIAAARNSLGIVIAGDRAAAKMFSQGALIGGLAVPREGETVDRDDAKAISEELDTKVGGWENAASIAVINRRLELTPWTMSNEDAQFLQSRQFQVEEIARWTGVPPHLLMQTEKQTSWGTGVAEQNRGLSRFTLANWTARLEARLSRLLPSPRYVHFDYTEWNRPTPEQEIELLIRQAGGPILTVNEARARLGMPPLDDGNELRAPTPELPQVPAVSR